MPSWARPATSRGSATANDSSDAHSSPDHRQLARGVPDVEVAGYPRHIPLHSLDNQSQPWGCRFSSMHHEGPGFHRPSDESVMTGTHTSQSLPSPAASDGFGRTDHSHWCSLVCIPSTRRSAQDGRASRSPIFTGESSGIAVSFAADSLPPFPKCRAFPGSEYYGGSAPLRPRQPTVGLAVTPLAATREARTATVPVFTDNRMRQVRHPAPPR